MLYYFLFCGLFLFALIEPLIVQHYHRRFLLVIWGVIFITISGLRWRTGTDWLPYEYFFTSNNTLSEFYQVPFEPLFVLLNFIVKSISDSYTSLLFIVAIFVISIKYYVYNRLAYFPLFSIFCNASICALDLFTVRQGIAIAITMFSVLFIINKKPLYFFICIIFAMMFHVTAVLFLFAYYIFNSNLNVVKVLLSIAFLFIISHAISLIDVIKSIVGIFSDILLDKAESYQELDFEAASNIPLWLREYLGFAKKFFLLAVFSWAVAKPRVSGLYAHTLRGFYNLFAFGVMVSVLLGSIHPVFQRFGMYFSIYETFLIPVVALSFTNRSRLIVVVVLSLYLLSRFYYGFAAHPDLFFPYESIFDYEYKEVY